jgi:trimeric autotransporter adhesin
MQTKHLSIKKYTTFVVLILFFSKNIAAQNVAINTDGSTANTSAILDVKSTTKGLLIPRLTQVQKNAIPSPATGLLIFQTAPDSIGFHYYNGSQWLYLLNNIADSVSWKTNGNLITGNKFIGTLNDSAIRFRVNNLPSGFIDSISLSTAIGYKSLTNQDAGPNGNTAFGYKTLSANTIGFYNTAVGASALRENISGTHNTAIGLTALRENISGYENTGIGESALRFNTTGYRNVAIGVEALYRSKSSFSHTAIGRQAMFSDTIGQFSVAIGDNALANNARSIDNVAVGAYALNLDSLGFYNTAIGTSALRYNKYGFQNVAVGTIASLNNFTGYNNTAVGFAALAGNQTGTNNTAIGYQSLSENVNSSLNIAIGNNASFKLQTSVFGATEFGSVSMGSNAMYSCKSCAANIAIGAFALYSDTIGVDNVAIGVNALGFTSNGFGNTALGQRAGYFNKTGIGNVSLGSFSGLNNVSGNYNIAIGNNAGSNQVGASNMIAIGYNAGQVGGNTNTVEIGNTSMVWIGGQTGWFNYSDERIKENINYNNVPGLAFIKKLQPATYYFNIHKQNKLLGIADTINWEGKYDIEKIQQTGFIAQQVAQAAKELNYNFSGVQAPINGKGLYSLQYSSFVVPMIKAIKEEDERIEKLEIENNKLQKEIQELKKIVTNLIQIQNEKK